MVREVSQIMFEKNHRRHTIYQTSRSTRVIYKQKSQLFVEKIAYPTFEGTKLNFIQMLALQGRPCRKKIVTKVALHNFCLSALLKELQTFEFFNFPKINKNN